MGQCFKKRTFVVHLAEHRQAPKKEMRSNKSVGYDLSQKGFFYVQALILDNIFCSALKQPDASFVAKNIDRNKLLLEKIV